MPKSTTKNDTPDMPNRNPSVDPQTGTVNPSAPTVGTEQWGNTSDERRMLGDGDRPATPRAPQAKSSRRNKQAEAGVRPERADNKGHATDPAKKPKHVVDPSREQTDLSSRTSASAYSLNSSQGHNAPGRPDLANSGLRETSSDDKKDENEVTRQFEERWRHDRGLGDWTAAMRKHVRDNIPRRG
jgi:hypothetical protein